MISRLEWERAKQREIDELDHEAECLTRRAEALYERICRLEEQSYEDYLADGAFDDAKARREDVL